MQSKKDTKKSVPIKKDLEGHYEPGLVDGIQQRGRHPDVQPLHEDGILQHQPGHCQWAKVKMHKYEYKNKSRLHTCHLVILPLIPVVILLMQNASAYISNNQSISDLQDVTTQVLDNQNVTDSGDFPPGE